MNVGKERDNWIDLRNATEQAIRDHPSVLCVCGHLEKNHDVWDQKFDTLGCHQCGCHKFVKWCKD